MLTTIVFSCYIICCGTTKHSSNCLCKKEIVVKISIASCSFTIHFIFSSCAVTFLTICVTPFSISFNPFCAFLSEGVCNEFIANLGLLTAKALLNKLDPSSYIPVFSLTFSDKLFAASKIA